MRIQVVSKSSAPIQLDMGTVQGSTLSPLLFDLFINALLRLLDSTGISHRVRGVPDWNHQAFADDLSLYVCSTEDANPLLSISLFGKNLANNGHSSYTCGSLAEPPEASAGGNFFGRC
jgi:hypothetical protein